MFSLFFLPSGTVFIYFLPRHIVNNWLASYCSNTLPESSRRTSKEFSYKLNSYRLTDEILAVNLS